MKKFVLLSVAAFILHALPVNADIFYRVINGIRYGLDTPNRQAYVVSANGEVTYSGDIIIPSTVEYGGYTYNVVRIQNSAFKNNTEITSMVLPNCIESIGQAAFYGCSNLKSINMPDSVIEFGAYAFYKCIYSPLNYHE